MEQPGFPTIQIKNEFVFQLEGVQLQIGKFPKHFIMIPGEVADADVLGNKFHDLADHFHMRIGPVALAELTKINDISFHHEMFRSNTPKIIKKLTGIKDIGSQMHTRKKNIITITFK